MDLESEPSVIESVEDNEGIATPEKLAGIDENNVDSNGSWPRKVDNYDAEVKGNGGEVSEPVNSVVAIAKASPSSATTKGYGLRKWRRIKRDVRQDGDSSVDTSKILKRGLSNSLANAARPVHFSAKSGGSVSSTDAIVRSPAGLVDGFGIIGDSGSLPAFAAGTDSENSEDRSSKSSTAASAPKMKYEMPGIVAHARDKNRMKTVGGKNVGTSVQQQGQQGKARTETSKKPRGERVKIEKEHSHSSMESDSRSSNFFFMQGTNSVNSNGRQSERSANCDGENSDDEAHGSEQHLIEEIQTAYEGRNFGDHEEVFQEDTAADLSWDAKDGKSKNHVCSNDRDPLADSILALQSAQEALENEVQKFKEIGDEDIRLDDSFQDGSLPSELISTNPELSPGLSEQLQPGEDVDHPLCSVDSELGNLKEKVTNLENKLNEATLMLKTKEEKVHELEAILSGRTEEETAELELHQNDKDVESELEGLFKQKIEAEVEYLTISRTIQALRVATMDRITLLEEEKAAASEQVQIMNKLGDVELKAAATLRTEAERLEKYCEDIVSSDETLQLKKRVYKYTTCFLIQFLLLVILGLFALQLSPQSSGVVPT